MYRSYKAPVKSPIFLFSVWNPVTWQSTKRESEEKHGCASPISYWGGGQMKQVGRLSIKRLIISPYPPLGRSFLIFKSTAREMETFPVQDVTSPFVDNFGGWLECQREQIEMNSIGDPFHWLIDQLFEMACDIFCTPTSVMHFIFETIFPRDYSRVHTTPWLEFVSSFYCLCVCLPHVFFLTAGIPPPRKRTSIVARFFCDSKKGKRTKIKKDFSARRYRIRHPMQRAAQLFFPAFSEQLH